MKTAVIFPGQGSQYKGMGHDFYNNYQESKQIYDTLNDILKKDLASLIFFGEETELSHTQNSQPAIMATSIAILKALISEKLLSSNSFQAVAGHSLGEYSALVANDSINFEVSVNLLKARSKAMQESMPIGTGGMIALIGCQDDKVQETIEKAFNHGKIFVANDNAIGQIVLSGEIGAIEYILKQSKDLGIKRVIKLPVSAPFHCELMGHASSVMELELQKIDFHRFSVPLYSNVTAKICDENTISKLLIEQVVSKVRWREILENMIKDGFERFIEIGPGSVLTNLVKRVSSNVETYSISKLDDFEKLSKISL